MVVNEGVGAEAAHTVRRLSADVGEEDVASLVTSGILELVPISNPEQVIIPHVIEIDHSRFTILPRTHERFLLGKFFPITHGIRIDDSIET